LRFLAGSVQSSDGAGREIQRRDRRVLKLMNDQTGAIDFSVFEQVDIRVGRVSSVEVAEGCRVPAYKLAIDFAPELGTRRSIAQATNYSPQSIMGNQVLDVVNLKPRQVGKQLSDVLVLGVHYEG